MEEKRDICMGLDQGLMDNRQMEFRNRNRKEGKNNATTIKE